MCERRNIWNISEYFTCTVMSKMFRFLTLYRWGIWITNSIQPFVHDSHPTISNEETFLWCTVFCLACLNILLHTGVLPVAKGLTLMSHRKIRYELLWVSYWFTVRMKGEREKERERKRERWESLGRDRERGEGSRKLSRSRWKDWFHRSRSKASRINTFFIQISIERIYFM